jgi:hypothetical protein
MINQVLPILGTRDFAFYDLDGNGLTFYRDLAKAEMIESPSQ